MGSSTDEEEDKDGRSKRDSWHHPIKFFNRLAVVWKVAIVLSGAATAGIGGYAYLQQYVKEDKFSKVVAKLEEKTETVQKQIIVIQIDRAATKAQLINVQSAVDETKDQVTELLRFLLKNPAKEE